MATLSPQPLESALEADRVLTVQTELTDLASVVAKLPGLQRAIRIAIDDGDAAKAGELWKRVSSLHDGISAAVDRCAELLGAERAEVTCEACGSTSWDWVDDEACSKCEVSR